MARKFVCPAGCEVTDHGASPVASIPRLLRSLGKRRQPSSQDVQCSVVIP